MPIIVDHIRLEENNPVFFQAADFVMYDGPRDYDAIFLTGKAGTGKTTFLKYIKSRYKGKMVILAPTGVAAINAGGQTIHSFFHLQLSPYMPEDKRLNRENIYQHLQLNNNRIEVIRKMNLLVIDEVSMLRCDLMDAIDAILKIYRRCNKPFGGVKLLLIGDVFQLPPVVKDEDGSREMISHFYPSEHFFSSHAFQKAKCIFFELNIVFRQSELNFMEALDNIRCGVVREKDISLFNEHVNDPFPDEKYIYLASTNNAVNYYNQCQFERLDATIIRFQGIIKDEFKMSMVNVEQIIDLKLGTQVMTVRNKYANDSEEFLYYNGSIGTVTEIDPMARWLKVFFTDTGREVVVTPEVWENIEYEWDFEHTEVRSVIKGSFTQIPIRLAWAITIHKSQGLSFDSIKVDFSNVNFTHGLVYVALSRCRRLSGLHLTQQLSRSQIRVDQVALDFSRTQTTSEELERILNNRKADKLYSDSWNLITKGKVHESLLKFDEAVRTRNDILTTGFERYVKVYVERFQMYRQRTAKYVALRRTYQKSVDDLLSAQREARDVNGMLECSKRNEVKLTKEFKEAKSVVDVLDKQLQRQHAKIIHLENEVYKRDREILDLKNEIERLMNLPWWKLLSGKKR